MSGDALGARWRSVALALGECTMADCAELLAGPTPIVILPVGSTEPHGPHLPLATDAILSEECARRAARSLRERGASAVCAPAIAYGVTRYAEGFAGAITVSEPALVAYITAVIEGLRGAGFALVCVTNHHLEPEHVTAVERAVNAARDSVGGVVFANQLTRRWGRTLSHEFKRGACHAGSYESSLVQAARPELVREDLRAALPDVDISLSAAIREGKHNFAAMGLTMAYAGEPREASATAGEALYDKLVEMIAAECLEALGLAAPPAEPAKK
ncbi:MAG: creatininase family protein [Myxococcales bacterium]|nr:creatininase family protein [Myxococcales bacterium]